MTNLDLLLILCSRIHVNDIWAVDPNNGQNEYAALLPKSPDWILDWNSQISHNEKIGPEADEPMLEITISNVQ